MPFFHGAAFIQLFDTFWSLLFCDVVVYLRMLTMTAAVDLLWFWEGREALLLGERCYGTISLLLFFYNSLSCSNVFLNFFPVF